MKGNDEAWTNSRYKRRNAIRLDHHSACGLGCFVCLFAGLYFGPHGMVDMKRLTYVCFVNDGPPYFEITIETILSVQVMNKILHIQVEHYLHKEPWKT